MSGLELLALVLAAALLAYLLVALLLPDAFG